MTSREIRKKFLDFFKQHGHTIVPSSSVVPHDDPSLLFVNAGMNQFKDVFLGRAEREYKRAATSQKCIRVGGKHNDLDNVGHTSRHLTFFEMLGNFSFGDYFKETAIEYAWKVSTEIFEMPEDRIWATVFDDDDEAFELWKRFLPESKIVRMGEKDNFWSMGETGPCGPCSELLFDRGSRYGSAGNPKEDSTGERFLEFWNLVFMEFNKGSQGRLDPLPKKSIDTGSGMERLIALKTGVDNVFQTDILRALIARTEDLFSIRYEQDSPEAPAFHVIADHVRSLAFAIADGGQPGNVERGYVLRKIVRRAVRYGRMLGPDKPFLAKIVPTLIDIMGSDYPELISSKEKIGEVLTVEEESFFRTLKRGGSILQQVIDKARTTPLKQISGEEAFKLKDTYGFPLEEILLLAKDTGLEVNLDSYQLLEEQAKERSRAAETTVSQESAVSLFEDFTEKHGTCAFVGYDTLSCESTILALLHGGRFVESLSEGQEGAILLRKTPFYPAKGGQTGDTGELIHQEALFTVTDCKTPYPDVILHLGRLEKGVLIPGEPLVAQVDEQRRRKIASNHTATHLLHEALQHVLGAHIRQAGSSVEPSRLRFDFNHHKSISKEELREIEKRVNTKIRENTPVSCYEIPYEEAQNRKEIKQFFGDKYGSVVRVVDMGSSVELCGGTHAASSGAIGFCKIVKEGSISAGVRRIEAVTGAEAEEAIYQDEAVLDTLCSALNVPLPRLKEKVLEVLEENKQYESELKTYKKKELRAIAKELLEKAEKIGDVLFVSGNIPVSSHDLPIVAEELSSARGPLLVVLGSGQGDSCRLFVKVGGELQSKGVHAGSLVKELAACIEGTGGGKGDSAQAGGKKPEGLSDAFALAKTKLQSLCSAK